MKRRIHYKSETLRFMTDPNVPFTNNLGEEDIRMTKTHQKISRFIGSQIAADTFCRVRNHLDLPKKQRLGKSGFESAVGWQTTGIYCVILVRLDE
ncbi:transposase [Methylicorpusculum oleiharenae]|nr:transposase [Methylicorpusculum oleiharenae]